MESLPTTGSPPAISVDKKLQELLTQSTWVERILLNLLSYSLILLPIAVIVFATRNKLLPSFLQNSLLIQLFVHGGENKTSKTKNHSDESLQNLIISSRPPPRHSNLNEAPKESSTLTFIWCFLGLQFSYLIWGVLQERIMSTKYKVETGTGTRTIVFHDSQFLVFINRIVAFILSIIALVYYQERGKPTAFITNYNANLKPQAPLYEYVYCSLSNILSSWCQYEALKYVNFPTQVLSKSCKIVAVMLMSRLLLKKKFHSTDYFFSSLLSLGMFIFLLYQPEESKHSQELANSNLISGLIILSLYLLFDSFTSNWQQNLFTKYRVTNWQMMAATNFYSIILTLTSLHQLGTLKPALELISSSRLLLLDCLFTSVMSSIGQLFVYYTIRRFGSVIFAVIMTMRQFFAILLSCALYGHQLTLGSTAGLLLVFLVVGYQLWSKSASSRSNTASTNKSVQLTRA